MDSQTEQELPPFPVLLRALRLRVLKILTLPFTIVLNSFTNVFRVVAPLTFHIFLLASLIPFLAVSSIGVGLIIRSWISTEWTEVVHLHYGEGQPPYAEFQLPEFSQIPFDISLELILPIFAKNTELGAVLSPHPAGANFQMIPAIYYRKLYDQYNDSNAFQQDSCQCHSAITCFPPSPYLALPTIFVHIIYCRSGSHAFDLNTSSQGFHPIIVPAECALGSGQVGWMEKCRERRRKGSRNCGIIP
jgi:Putative adipose-regulatory protein (Seipin)